MTTRAGARIDLDVLQILGQAFQYVFYFHNGWLTKSAVPPSEITLPIKTTSARARLSQGVGEKLHEHARIEGVWAVRNRPNIAEAMNRILNRLSLPAVHVD